VRRDLGVVGVLLVESVHDGVPPPALHQPVVDRYCGDERNGQGDCQPDEHTPKRAR